MPVTITGSNTPTAGGVVYGDGTTYASTSAGTSGQALVSGGAGAPSFGTLGVAAGGTGSTSLTANNVLLGNGTSALQVVAPGTNGNVLTSNGTTWTSATPGAAGSWVYLSAVTANASATVDVENVFNVYDVYAIVFSGVRNSASTGLTITLKIGGSYLGGSTDYTYKIVYASNQNATWTVATDNGAGAASIAFTGGALGNNAADTAGGVIYIFTPSNSAIAQTIIWNGYTRSNGAPNVMTYLEGAGGARTTGALTGVRFTPGSGNISTGTFRLYGIKNS